jgi:cardiolipin synthase
MSKKRTPRFLAGYTHHNEVRLIHGGTDYFSTLVQLIDKAKNIIHLQTYIFDGDETGQQISAALLRAAARKIQVYILLDGYASQHLPREIITSWKAAGIHFRWFWPLFKSRHFYFGRRMHHKVVAIDASFGMAGGINISDRYNDIGGQPAWLDRALLVEGQAALKLHIVCRDMWAKAYWRLDRPDRDNKFAHLPGVTPGQECLVRIRRNDWVQGKNQISRSYVEMFRQARSHVIVLSAYFMPGTILRKQMALAAGRGVRIRIIVGAVSDVKIARLAEQYMYRWLFNNRIEVYEYQGTVLHGKMAAYDGIWMTNGSYNVNRISAYASVELNMDVRNNEFAAQAEADLEDIIRNHCTRVDPKNYFLHRSWFQRLRQWIGFQTVRFIFFLFTFYFKQDKESK